VVRDVYEHNPMPSSAEKKMKRGKELSPGRKSTRKRIGGQGEKEGPTDSLSRVTELSLVERHWWGPQTSTKKKTIEKKGLDPWRTCAALSTQKEGEPLIRLTPRVQTRLSNPAEKFQWFSQEGRENSFGILSRCETSS